MKDYNNCETGVMLAYTSSSMTPESFFEKNIKKIFSVYKDNLKKYDSNSSSDYSDLYDPQCFVLWSNQYDLITISQIVEFEFPTRIFMPFVNHGNKNESKLEGFEYNVLNGLLYNQDYKNIFSSKSLAKTPLISICQIKLNNSIIIGRGFQLFDHIIELIEDVIAKHKPKSKDVNLKFLIVKSIASNELTLVFLSNSIKEINDIIIQLRALDLKQLGANIKKQLYDDLTSKTLLFKSNNSLTNEELELCPLFEDTNTSYGFHLNLLPDHTLSSSVIEEVLMIMTRITVMAGIDKVLYSDLKTRFSAHDVFISSGRGDISIFFKGNISDIIECFHDLTNFLSTKYPNSVKSIFSFPLFDNDFNQKSQDDDEARDQKVALDSIRYRNLVPLAIDIRQIERVKELLKIQSVPKVYRVKVLKLFSLFNTAVNDSDLNTYFLEVRPFISKLILSSLKTNEANEELCNKHDLIQGRKEFWELLSSLCKTFEESYMARYLNTYQTWDVNETNLHLSGAIQGLLACLDGSYKAISLPFETNQTKYANLTSLSGDSGIVSSFYDLKINYIQVWQIGFFFATFCHEATNFYLEKLLQRKFIQDFRQDQTHGRSIHFMNLRHLSFFLKTLEIEPNGFYLKNFTKTVKPPSNLPGDNQSLISFFSEKGDIFRYLIIDQLTYYNGYNCNFDLFKFWTFAYAIQNGSLVSFKKGELLINKAELTVLLFRLIHVSYVHSRYKSTGKAEKLEWFDNDPNVESILSTLRHFISSEYLSSNLEKLFRDIHECYIEIFSLVKTQESFLYFELIAMVNYNKIRKEYPSYDEICESNFLTDEGEIIQENLIVSYLNLRTDCRFLENELKTKVSDYTFLFDSSEKKNRTSFSATYKQFKEEYIPNFKIKALSISYLDILYKKINSCPIIVLQRDSDGHPVSEDYLSDIHSPALIDPQGGFFFNNLSFKKEVFCYNSIVYQELWCISQSIKLDIISGIKTAEKTIYN